MVNYNVGKDHPMYGKKHSEETKKKMRKSHLGFKHSEESKGKISKGHLGKKFSKETREKMSKAKSGKNHPLYGIRGKNHPNYGRKNSKETIEKMSKAQSGKNHHMYGKKHSEETKEKMRQSHLVFKHSEETKERVSKVKSGENIHRYGKKHTEESKEKIRQSRLGKKHSEETKEKMSKAKSGKNNPMYGKKPSLETRKKNSKKHILESKLIFNNGRTEIFSKSYNKYISINRKDLFLLDYLEKRDIKYLYMDKKFNYIQNNNVKVHYIKFYLIKYDLHIDIKYDNVLFNLMKFQNFINSDNNLIIINRKHLNEDEYDLFKTIKLYKSGNYYGYRKVIRKNGKL